MKYLVLLGLVLLTAASLWAVGAVQISEVANINNTGNWMVTANWTGDAANGSVPAATTALTAVQGYNIVQVEVVPQLPAPSANYSLTVTDARNFDILTGQGLANLSATQSQSFQVAGNVPPLLGALTFNISGQTAAGAKGQVLIWFQKPVTLSASFAHGGGGGSGLPSCSGQIQYFRTAANQPSGTIECASLGVRSSDYNFPAQTPAGLLTGGTPATVTLKPCPLGVNGTDTNHWLYVSGGIGTAEPVMITGGTCASGAVTGTIQFTPANNHGGAWMVTSSSAGIQEAVWAVASTGGIVSIPAAIYNIFATISIPSNNIQIIGSGDGTVLSPQSSNLVMFSVNNIPGYAGTVIQNLHFAAIGFPGVNTIYGIKAYGSVNLTFSDLFFDNIVNAISVDTSTNVTIRHITTLNDATLFVGSTVNMGSAASYPWPGAMYSKDVHVYDWKSYLPLLHGNPSTPVIRTAFAATVQMELIQIQSDGTREGIRVDQHCEDVTLSQADILGASNGIDINNSGWTRIINSSLSSNAVGVLTTAGYATVISGSTFTGPEDPHIQLSNDATGYPGSNISINGNYFDGTGTGASQSSILINLGVQSTLVMGNHFNTTAAMGAPNYGVYIAGGGTTDYTIVANDFYQNPTYPTTPIFDNANSPSRLIKANNPLSQDDGVYNFNRPTVFAALGSPLNGIMTYCSDCTIAATCSGSGSGAFAKRINGAWVCN